LAGAAGKGRVMVGKFVQKKTEILSSRAKRRDTGKKGPIDNRPAGWQPAPQGALGVFVQISSFCGGRGPLACARASRGLQAKRPAPPNSYEFGGEKWATDEHGFTRMENLGSTDAGFLARRVWAGFAWLRLPFLPGALRESFRRFFSTGSRRRLCRRPLPWAGRWPPPVWPVGSAGE